ncbi:hypothetical protein [Shewanella colwelliana]|uniref:hypothetical protein n=1 Tax=Shewanella colwelliana TaxID=23 RepID=UPI003736DB54
MHIEYMRDKNQVMPSIENPSQVTSMSIWHCNFESLKQVSDCVNLEQLNIATLPDNNFDFLAKCPKLKLLSIVHLPEIKSLDSFPFLKKLETVSLSTLPSWDSSGKKTIVDSLLPLAKLPNLKYLELFGVIPEIVSLETLNIFSGLNSARFSKYPKKITNAFYKQTGISDDWAPEFKIAN